MSVMQQLSGMDAGFLYMETPTLHMHTLKLAIVDPSKVPGGYSFEKVRDVLAAHLHLLPPFRRRLVEIPFGLGHPIWIEDPDFDLDRHLSRHVVAAPGSTRELCQIVSEIAGRPLDRLRPLWEIAVVEGLEHGNIGFVAKLHHCIADGAAALALLLNVLRTNPEAVEVPPPTRPWQCEPVPSRGALLRRALRATLGHLRALPRLLLRTIRGLFALRHHIRTHRIAAPAPFRAPVTSFNHALSTTRSFGVVSLPLPDLKAIRLRFGVTLNDVVLAVCSGALRYYLAERGELPEASLTVGVPVNTQPDERDRLSGNRVGNLTGTLRTDLDDPVARLRGIHEVMEDAKARMAALGIDMIESWAEFTPPRPYSSFMRSWSRFKLSDRIQPPFNLVISNVPGPRSELHIAGARLRALYSVGPILEGIGLNITAWSYGESLHLAFLACPEHVPDIWKLIDRVPQSLDELRSL